MAEQSKGTMVPTLGLTGVTVNAMALIAPGAFLWLTFQLQAAQTVPGGTDSTALDMWPGIIFALILAFLTALSYAELARKYPEAGTGSTYYFAEKAFVDKAEVRHHKWARIAKLVTGWAAHLFYWVYPGVMVAFLAILISQILGYFGADVGVLPQMVIAVIGSIGIGYIALRGANGSAMTSLVMKGSQHAGLSIFSEAAILFSFGDPHPDLVARQ